MQSKTRLSISIIKPLYKLTTVLAITPSYNFATHKPSKNYLIHTILTIIIFTITPVFSLRERFQNTYPFTPNLTDNLLDCGLSISLTVTTLVNLIHIRLLHYKKLLCLFRKFEKLDEILKAPEEESVRIRFYTENSIFALISLTGLVYNQTIWDWAFGFVGNWGFFFQNFQKIQLVSTGLLIHNIALAFKHRFKYLNKSLESIEVVLLVKKDLVYPSGCESLGVNVREINKAHKTLLLMFREFNGVFGTPLWYLSLVFVFGILHPINSIILQMLKGNVMSGIDIPDFGTHYIFITTLLTCSTLILCIPLASSCNSVVEEAKRTSKICEIMLNQLPIFEYDEASKNLAGELGVIARDSVGNYPRFTANGFFLIDHTMLFTLFGAVTSYLIVLIQLNIS